MAAPSPRGQRVLQATGRLLQNTGAALRDVLLAPFEARVPRAWVVLRLDRGLVETTGAPAWMEAWREQPRTLRTVLDCLERARRDPELRGLLLRVGSAGLGWAKATAVARALSELRSAGKLAVVYAETTGNAGAWLGALADHFWVAPGGRIDLLGVRLEQPFVRRLLDRLGVRPEVLRAGRYKTVGELLTHDALSPPSREALESLVEDLYTALVDGLAEGKGVAPEQARRWIDEGPYLGAEAQEAGLVDELVYADEIPRRLAQLSGPDGAAGGEGEAELINELVYLRLARDRFRWRPVWSGHSEIAVVPVIGLLRRGSASRRGVVGVLRRLARNQAVRAVVLRIDSPGGDALASDLIWRAVRKLAAEKPVVASLGDTAASGGYYLAMGANEIVAEATTLTGSIGVVLASLDLSELLERLGIRIDSVERGRHAGIYDPTRSRSEEERALLRRQVKRLYADFVSKAADGRGLSYDELEGVAQGRVWTGQRAREIGLVDHLGGLDTALRRARALAGLGEDEGEVTHTAAHPSPLSRLLRPDPLWARTETLSGVQLLCPIQVPLR